MSAVQSSFIAALRAGEAATWTRDEVSRQWNLGAPELSAAIEQARKRFRDFRAPLAALFRGEDWDGEIRSDLIDWPAQAGSPHILVKADHNLPVTGSIKARGGLHELLAFLEYAARREGLLGTANDYAKLAEPGAVEAFSHYRVSVASTGNLGYSVGLVGRTFGLGVTVHMSRDAKSWKKDRLRKLGATVVEHAGDYGEACAAARAMPQDEFSHFVDDENSPDLFCGYAVAAEELATQLAQRGIIPSAHAPIVVYLPCGVGGAPGGITYGLKRIFGNSVLCVFVEPTQAPAMFAALATRASAEHLPSIYDYGLDNVTLADGLAVGRASALAFSAVGQAIDGAVTLTDRDMLRQAAQAWTLAGLKLETSAAAALAAIPPFIAATAGKENWPDLNKAIHIAWVTGGAKLPEAEWLQQLRAAGPA